MSDETLAHLSPFKWEHINLTGGRKGWWAPKPRAASAQGQQTGSSSLACTF